MATLSVVLATYNEEDNLGKCLDSVKNLADEIVVVDGTSQDKTVEIAKKYKAKVKVTTNKQVFHVNKQMAIDMATKDWVLQLDADEIISSDLAEEIMSNVNPPAGGQMSNVNGYWIPRKNWFLTRFLIKGGQYPDYTLRLYRNGKGRLPQKDVHEQAVVDGRVRYLKNPLLHYPYKNFNDYLVKWNRYCDLMATQLKDRIQNKTIFTLLLFGFSYIFIKSPHWFLTTYLRHKGFMDYLDGFIFSFFSALRFPFSYFKYIIKAS
jgi:glycosyltransferase involved in cell wall biosynthesis